MAKSQVDLKQMRKTRHIIYGLVALAVILPYLPPFNKVVLSLTPSKEAEKLYDYVDDLSEGSHILVAFDYGPASEAELRPMSRAILRHCFKKGLIPIIMTHWNTGVGICKEVSEQAAAESKEMWGTEKISGRDYVLLGYKPGMTDLVLNMGENLKGAFPKDYYGKSTLNMEALKGVDSLKDLDFAIDLAAGVTVEGVWIPYGSDRFGFPMGAGTTAVMAPDMYPFLDSGQLKGLLGGLRGAADYEEMLNKPDDAAAGMLAQSATHVLLIALILGANARFIYGKIKGRRKAES